MDRTSVTAWARELATASTADLGATLTAALPILQDTFGARAAVLVRPPHADGPLAEVGSAPRWPELAHLVREAPSGRLTRIAIPELARTAGVAEIGTYRLAGEAGVLVLVWDASGAVDGEWLELVLQLIDVSIGRRLDQDRYAELTERVDDVQRMANMGDYDWDIASDTNRWSDQMYRIYGHRPGAFEPDYATFLSHVHPDDRMRIHAIHQAAQASAEPYSTTERIVRPDGEVRYLASNGLVIRGPEGTAARMRGTCIDITDRVRAEDDRERTAARFHRLVDANPDAIVLVENDTIVMANRHAHELLAGNPIGQRFSAICHDAAGAASAGTSTSATGLDGMTLVLDVSVAELPGEEGLTAVFLRDASPRIRNDRVAATLREATVRRSQALELNDTVVQGLTASLMSLQGGDVAECETYLVRTLQSARHMMNDWLTPLDGHDLQPGDLVRTTESTIAAHPPIDHEASAAVLTLSTRSAPRIVIVDDNDDVRRLLRVQIERLKTYEVIGEAADGAEAIEVAAATQPDVVFLDMAMPRMDGLEALPHILKAAPSSRVVVLSGFDAGSMADKVIEAGASRYLEKGLRLNFREIIDGVMSAA